MLKIVTLLACACLTLPTFARGSGGHSHSSGGGGSHAVRAHTTKNGTYVAATRATNPNRTKVDNYSSKGNVNPANGRVGTKDPNK